MQIDMDDGRFFGVDDRLEHCRGGPTMIQFGVVDDAGGGCSSRASSSGGGSFDLSLEPLQRGRANTWHGRARDDLAVDDESRSTPSTSVDSTCESGGDQGPGFGVGGLAGYDGICSAGAAAAAARKATSRRNAWGNLSYADLITKAIESSPEKRLTLSQIYAWMVTNVPFFRDKGESNSSAGWKNSIRHNLSLHSRFMRVQNEGTGKSSWWVLNPDAARTVKTPRRPRALTLDTKSYERQRRGRAAGPGRQSSCRGLLGDPCSDLGGPSMSGPHSAELGVPSGDPFVMEYRTRAGSFGGRLPPIESHEPEIDAVDSCRFATIDSTTSGLYGDGSETLSETLADIFAGDLRMSADAGSGGGDGQSDLGQSDDMMSPGSSSTGGVGSSAPGGYGDGPTMMEYFQMDHYRPLQQRQQDRFNAPLQTVTEPSGYDCMASGAGYTSAPTGCRNMTSGHVTQQQQQNGTDMSGGGGGGCAMMNGCAAGGVGAAMMGFGGSGSGGGGAGGSAAQPQHLGFHSSSLTELQDVKPPLSCMFGGGNQSVTVAAATSSGGGGGGGAVRMQSSSDMSFGGPTLSGNGGPSVTSGWYGRGAPPGGPGLNRFGRPRLSQAAIARILAERPHLMAKMQQLIQMKREQLAAQLQRHHQQILGGGGGASTTGNGYHLVQGMAPVNSMAAVGSDTSLTGSGSCGLAMPSSTTAFPSDLDLSGLDFSTVDMDCDIDQVIRHELALDGKLDFMFDCLSTPGCSSN